MLGCLAYRDSTSYANLFLPFDTLWSMVLHNPDRSPESTQAMNDLKEHPQSLIEFDPYYNHSIIARFNAVIKKGEDSGIHWNDIVMQRYELQKQAITRNLKGYDRIAPERFKGYMFVRDMLGRLTFCITITEIQKINGYFFGGQVVNILEASSVDEYLIRENEERKYMAWLAKNRKNDTSVLDSAGKKKADSLMKKNVAKGAKTNLYADTAADDEKSQLRKEVIDRKYYEGKFDDEIPVKLYVRVMKDTKTGKQVTYDGLYKFGDQTTYAKLNITKTPDGKWVMEDDPPVGTLELELKDKNFTGSWTNNENQTGYDVVLNKADISQSKLERFEAILENGLNGSVNEDAPIKEKKKKGADEADEDRNTHRKRKNRGGEKNNASDAQKDENGKKGSNEKKDNSTKQPDKQPKKDSNDDGE